MLCIDKPSANLTMEKQHRSTLVDLFQTGACLNPDKAAVIYDDGNVKQMITYSSVQTKASLLAAELKLLLPGEVVGIVMKPSHLVPVVLLGVLSIPAAFYSVDASTMKAVSFLKDVVLRLRLKTFVVDQSFKMFVEVLNEFGCARIKVHELKFLDLFAISFSCLDNSRDTCEDIRSSPLAYAITTSGTTGMPKIVRVPHACIVPNITHISEIYNLSTTDVVFQASPLTFDPSIVEIFTTFYVGATLLVLPDHVRMRPRDLAFFLTERNHVTVIQGTPTLMSSLGAVLLRQTLLSKHTSLRILTFGGERCPSVGTLRLWREDGNRTQFINIYGITEVSCWATWYCVSENDLRFGLEDVPLGNALAGTELEIRNVDTETRIGELWLGGKERVCQIDESKPGSAEYMRFSGDLVKHTSDGRLYFRGRKDDMVKRHGKRFHMQEIEMVVKRNTNVNQAVVLYTSDKLVLCIQMLKEVQFESFNSVDSSKSDKIVESCQVSSKICYVPAEETGSEQVNGVVIGSQHQNDSQLYHNQVASTVKKLVEQWLPVHCVPDDVMIVYDIPFTKHGKVDKKRLWEWYDARLSITRHGFSTDDSLLVSDVQLIACQLWKKYVSTDASCETHSFVECGGNSLSAICLAEDILCVLNTDKNNTLDLLIDVILHGRLQDFIDFLCDNLVNIKSPAAHVIDSGSTLNEADDVNHESMEGSGLLLNYITKEEETLPNLSIRNIRHLSSPDFEQTIKRSRLLSDKSIRFEVAASELCDSVSSDSDISTSVNNVSVCHCLVQNSQRPREFFHVGRGSLRVTCCHVNPTTGTRPSLAIPQSCCLANTSHLQLPVHFEGNEIDLKLAWKYDTGKCIDASPLIVCNREGQAHVYIGSHSRRFVAVNLDNGIASWDITLGGRIESSAVLSDCQQYLIVGSYDGKVYVISRSSGDIKWFYETLSQVKCSACVNPRNGFVYVGSHDKCLYALDVQKSRCLWKVNLGKGSIFSSPCLSFCPYQLVVGTLGGQLVSVHPDSGKVLWVYDFCKPLFSSPVPYHHGYIVGCVDHALYSISFAGDQLWSQRTFGPVFSSAFVGRYVKQPDVTDELTSLHVDGDCEVVLIGSHDRNVHCLRTLDGAVMWKVSLDSEVYSTPCVWRHDYAVACSQRGSIYIMKLLTGEIVAKFSCDGETFSSPVVMGNRFVVGCRDNSVYSFTIGKSTS